MPNKESEYISAPTVLPLILFYVLHFGCCSPFIPHASQSRLFQVSASKGTGENKCVLRSSSVAISEPTEAGSC